MDIPERDQQNSQRMAKKSKYFDFHSHVLSSIDDGSRDSEESLAMLRESARQGIGVIAATPHFYAGEQSISQFLTRRQESWERLKKHMEPGIPRVLLGAEVHYFEGIATSPDILDLRIQGTKLLLLEMPFAPWSTRMVRDVLELNSRPEMVVLLAHIERYVRFTSPNALDELYANQVMVQSNAEFFLNWKTKKRAMRMLEAREIHLLGSDCHNMGSRRPNMAQALEQIRLKLGQQVLDELQTRAEDLCSGEGAGIL